MTIRPYPSPNYNDRPGNCQPDMVVLHYTGMETGQGALERLCDPKAEVSAHYLIEESGETYQLVEPDKRAWHAGISHWQGRDNLNHYSIGIELVNPGHEFGYRSFPETQIACLLELLQTLKQRYGIKKHMYVGHSDIAPDRKEDPGEKFPWQQLASEGFGIWSEVNGNSQQALLDDSAAVSQREMIIVLQEKLRSIGYGIEISGVYDKLTTACVRAFQRRWRQKHVTGEYDAGTDRIVNDIIYQYSQF
ncbi:N-acetylmuramoyl-L-alanine amidase [Kordiimonas sp. SCSIO 12610]|uniref:peptidoglycan recognition protein family protein n=1 Tax=Kordiimonas sp. SCSIO 12610 TaxID=2829597 RepID=UPI002108C101|nr:N-acetylmuramoyl-L-alanine amidase [Kordiimonas sp. SCSIO 12610]UTW56391.1 N-acetylmuramoyl-L-alanine amidase [Kordiimonas sp. SCSIO 12610]